NLAGRHRVVRDRLEDLELVPVGAAVLVDRHRYPIIAAGPGGPGTPDARVPIQLARRSRPRSPASRPSWTCDRALRPSGATRVMPVDCHTSQIARCLLARMGAVTMFCMLASRWIAPSW